MKKSNSWLAKAILLGFLCGNVCVMNSAWAGPGEPVNIVIAQDGTVTPNSYSSGKYYAMDKAGEYGDAVASIKTNDGVANVGTSITFTGVRGIDNGESTLTLTSMSDGIDIANNGWIGAINQQSSKNTSGTSNLSVTGIGDIEVKSTGASYSAKGIGAYSAKNPDITQNTINIGANSLTVEAEGTAYAIQGTLAGRTTTVDIEGAVTVKGVGDNGNAYVTNLTAATPRGKATLNFGSVSSTSENSYAYGFHDAGSADADITLNGDMTVIGATSTLGFRLSGAADYDLKGKDGKEVDITVSSTSNTSQGTDVGNGSTSTAILNLDVNKFTVSSTKAAAYGLYVEASTGAAITGSVNNLSVTAGTDAYAIYTEGGSVTIEDSMTVSATGATSSYAVYATGGGTVTLGAAEKTVSLTGDVEAKDAGVINLTNVAITGAVFETKDSTANYGTINFSGTNVVNGDVALYHAVAVAAADSLTINSDGKGASTINNSIKSEGELNLKNVTVNVTDSSTKNTPTGGSYTYNNAIWLSGSATLTNATITENFAENNMGNRVRGIYVTGADTDVQFVTEEGKTTTISFDRDKTRTRSQTGWSYGIALGDGSDEDDANIVFSGKGDVNITGITSGGGTNPDSPYGWSLNGIRVNGQNNTLTFSNTGKTTITESGMYGVNAVVNYGTTTFNAGTVLINSYIDGGVAFSNNIGLYNSGNNDPSYFNVTKDVEKMTIFIEGAAYYAAPGSGDISDGAAAIYESSAGGTTIINAKKLNILAVSGENTNVEWTIGDTKVIGHTTYSEEKATAVGEGYYSTTYGIKNDYIGKVQIGADTVTNIRTRDFHKNSVAVGATGTGSIEILGNTTILAEGNEGTYSLYTENSGSITIGSEGKTVSITGDVLANGTYNEVASSITIAGSTNTITGDVEAADGGEVTVTGKAPTTEENVTTYYSTVIGDVTVGTDATINLANTSVTGYVQGTGTVNLSGTNTIKAADTSGDDNGGLKANGGTLTVNVAENVDLYSNTIASGSGNKVVMTAHNATIHGTEYAEIFNAYNGGSIQINEEKAAQNLKIKSETNNNQGLTAYINADLKVYGLESLEVTRTAANKGVNGVYASSGSNVTINTAGDALNTTIYVKGGPMDEDTQHNAAAMALYSTWYTGSGENKKFATLNAYGIKNITAETTGLYGQAYAVYETYGSTLNLNSAANTKATGEISAKSDYYSVGVVAAGGSVSIYGIKDIISLATGNETHGVKGIAIGVNAYGETTYSSPNSKANLTINSEKAAHDTSISAKSTSSDDSSSSWDAYAIGVYSYKEAAVNLNGIKNIMAEAKGMAYGLYSYSTTSGKVNDIDIDMAGTLSATTTNDSGESYGLYSLYYSDIDIEGNGTAEIKAVASGDNSSAYGVTAALGADVTLNNLAAITATGTEAVAVYASGTGAEINVNGKSVEDNTAITGDVYAEDSAEVNLKNVAITGAVSETKDSTANYGTIKFTGTNTVDGAVTLQGNKSYTTSTDSFSLTETGTDATDVITINGNLSVSGTGTEVTIVGTESGKTSITGTVTAGVGSTLNLTNATISKSLTNNGTATLENVTTTEGWTLAEGSVTNTNSLTNVYNGESSLKTGAVRGEIYSSTGTLDLRGTTLWVYDTAKISGGTKAEPVDLDTLKATMLYYGWTQGPAPETTTINNIILDQYTAGQRGALGVYDGTLTVDTITVDDSDPDWWHSPKSNFQVYTGGYKLNATGPITSGGTLVVNNSLTTAGFLNASSWIYGAGTTILNEGAVVNAYDFQNRGRLRETARVEGAKATVNATMFTNSAYTDLGTLNLMGYEHTTTYTTGDPYIASTGTWDKTKYEGYGGYDEAYTHIGSLNVNGTNKYIFKGNNGSETHIDAISTATSNGLNYYVTDSAQVVINENKDKEVALNGDIVFASYSDSTSDNAKFTLNLSSSTSYLTGSITGTTSKSAKPTGWGNNPVNGDEVTSYEHVKGMTLSMSNGATWTMTGDSVVNNLTINASTISKGTANDEYDLTLQGGNSSITNDAAVTANVVNETSSTLTLYKADAITGTITNKGTLNLSGDLTKSISGEGTTVLQDTTVKVTKSVSVAGTLDVGTGKTIAMTGDNSATDTVLTIGILKGSANLSFDVDLSDVAAIKSDKITINGVVETPTINVASVNVTRDVLIDKLSESHVVTYADGTAVGSVTHTVNGTAEGSVTATNGYTYTFTKGTAAGTLNYTVAVADVTFKKFIEGELEGKPVTLSLTGNMKDGTSGESANSGAETQTNTTLNINVNEWTLGTSGNNFTTKVAANKTVNLAGYTGTEEKFGTVYTNWDVAESGTLAISGKMNLQGSVSGSGSVTNSGELTVAAGNLGVAIANTSTVNLTGGELGYDITGNGKTVIKESVTVGAGKSIANTLEVNSGKILTIDAAGVDGAVTNSGTVDLREGKLEKEISGGTIELLGNVETAGANLKNSTLVDLKGNTLTISGGDLDVAIGSSEKATGTLAIAGTTTASKDIYTAVTVGTTGALTVTAGNISGAVENNNTLTISGATVSGAITNAGTMSVTAGTVSGAVENSKTLTVNGGKVSGNIVNTGEVTVKAGEIYAITNSADNAKLTANADYLKGAVANTKGTVELTGGELLQTITGGALVIYNKVTTSADNLKAATVTNEGYIALTGGSLTVALAGTLSNSGELTTAAGNLGVAIANTDTVNLTGGELGYDITGNGKTVIKESVTVGAGKSIANTLEVNSGKILTIDAAGVDGAITNSGTMDLREGKLEKEISGGTIELLGNVETAGANLKNSTLVDLKGNTLTISGGDLGVAIGSSEKVTGTLAIAGTTTASKDIYTIVTVGTAGDLTASAGTISGAVENNNTLTISGGTVSGAVTNSKTLAVNGGKVTGNIVNTGEVTVKAGEIYAITNSADNAKLTANADYLKGAVANTKGTVELTGGELLQTITGGALVIYNKVTTSADNLKAATVTNEGYIALTGGSLTVALAGTLSNSGELTTAAGNLGAALTNTDTVNLTGGDLGYDITGNGKTVIKESVTVGVGKSIANTLEVNSGKILTIDAAGIDGAITNSGTVDLREGELEKKINGGTVELLGNVETAGANLQNNFLVDLNGNTLTVSNGDLGVAIGSSEKATGTLAIAGTTTASKDIYTAVTVSSTGELTVTAGTVSGKLTNNGTVTAIANALTGGVENMKDLTLTGGALSSKINGSGDTVIDGAVDAGTKEIYQNNLSIKSGSLTANADNLKIGEKWVLQSGDTTTIYTDITNAGTLTLTGGTLLNKVKGGNVNITDEVTSLGSNLAGNEVSVTSELILTDGTVTFTDTVDEFELNDDTTIAVTGTLTIDKATVIDTTSDKIFTKALTEKGADTDDEYVAKNTDSGAVKTLKIDFQGGSVQINDEHYTLDYVKAAKTALSNASSLGEGKGTTSLIMMGDLVTAQGSNITTVDQIDDGSSEEEVTTHDKVTAATVNGSLLIGSNNVLTKEGAVDAVKEETDVTIRDTSATSVSVNQLDLRQKQATDKFDGVVITNGKSATLGGSQEAGQTTELIIVTDTNGKQIENNPLKVVVGLTEETAGALEVSKNGVLNIGNVNAVATNNYKLNGSMVINPESSVTVVGQTSITNSDTSSTEKGITINDATLNIKSGSKITTDGDLKINNLESGKSSTIAGEFYVKNTTATGSTINIGSDNSATHITGEIFTLDDSKMNFNGTCTFENVNVTANTVTVKSTSELAVDSTKLAQTQESTLVGIVTATTGVVVEKATDKDGIVKSDAVVTLNVGNESGAGVISAAKTALNGNVLFLDPVFGDDGILSATNYATKLEDNTMDGTYIVGRNSVLTLGSSDTEKATDLFNDADTQEQIDKTWSKTGISAAAYIVEQVKLGTLGSLTVNGALESVPTTLPTAGTVYFADNSLLMVADDFRNSDDVAISGIKKDQLKVDESSILFLEGAEVGDTYKILAGEDGIILTGGTNVWSDKNIKTSAITVAEGVYEENGNYFNVVIKDNTSYKFAGTVAPIALTAMRQADITTPAHKYISAVTSARYTSAEQNANMNRLADLPEELGVMHNHFNVTNISSDAVAKHLALDEHTQGREIWAQAIHNKENVSGLGLNIQGNSYDTQYNGAIVGVDILDNGKTTLGAALTYIDGKATAAGSHNEGKYYGVTLYGRSKVAENTGLQYDLSYTHSKNELDLASGCSYGQITGDQKVNSFSIGARLEQELRVGKSSSFVPHIGARWLRMKAGSFSNSLGNSYNPDATNSFILPLGLSFKAAMENSGWKMSFLADAGYQWNAGNRDYTQHFSYNGAGNAFDVNFADRGNWYAGAGFEFNKKNFTAGVSYRYAKGDSTRQNKWNVNLSWAF